LAAAGATSPVAAQLPTVRLEQLAGDAIQAGATFVPPDQRPLDAAAAGLRGSLGPLDSLLARSKSGAGWRAYLRWPTLEAQAATGAAGDPKTLGELANLFSAGETGLEMPEFMRVRRALARYATAAEVASEATGTDGPAAHRRRLESLAAALRKAAASGSAHDLANVPRIVQEIVDSGQSAPLVKAVRGTLGLPNAFFALHEDLLSYQVNRPIDQVQPVDELILGTRVRGCGRTIGTVRLDLVPCRDRAALELVFAAHNFAQTRGSQGPVTVRNRGVTALEASRLLLIDDRTVTPLPVAVGVEADSKIVGIDVHARLGRNLIRRIAARKAAEMSPRAEVIAEGRARDRLARQFTEQTDPAVARMRTELDRRVRGPLEDRGIYPELVQLGTSDVQLEAIARTALPGQLGAPSAPPPVATDRLIAARIHETAINDAFEKRFAGILFRQADAEKMARDAGRELPESLGASVDSEPWAVTFAAENPITVAFGDGKARLTIRGEGFERGTREYDGMFIQVDYRIAQAEGRWKLVREGDVRIYPKDFDPEEDRRLSLGQTAIRGMLKRRFDRLFKPEIEVQDLPLQGELESLGPLPLAELTARRDGWIVAAWREKSGPPRAGQEVAAIGSARTLPAR